MEPHLSHTIAIKAQRFKTIELSILGSLYFAFFGFSDFGSQIYRYRAS